MTEPAANPYRSTEPLARVPEPPPELVYAPGDRPRRGQAIRRATGVIWLGTMASVVVAIALEHAVVGGAVFAMFLVAAWWAWRRTRAATRVVLRVDDGRFIAERARGSSDLLSIPLSHIRNVRLETKTIEKLQTDRTIGALIVASSVRPAIDVSRVVIVPAKSWGVPFVLDAEYEPNFEAVEWLGKIRRFLRAYGWVPADERERKAKDSSISQ
jgi:hypothetical protein